MEVNKNSPSHLLDLEILSKLEAWFCWRPICDLCLILWTSWTTTSRRWGEAKTSWLKVRGDSSGYRFFFDPYTFPLEVIDRESSTKRMSALVKVYEEVFLFWSGLFVQDIVEVPKCSLWRLLVWRPILYAPEIEHRYHHLPFLKGITFSNPSFWISSR